MQLQTPLTETASAQAEAVAKHFQEILEGLECLPMLSNITEFTPDELEDIYARAYNAWDAGNYDSATTDFAFLALQQPMDRRFLFAFACALQHQGEYRHALTLFGHTVGMQANDPFAIFHIAKCFLELKETDAACDALDAVIALCRGQMNDDVRYDALRQQAEIMLINLNN